MHWIDHHFLPDIGGTVERFILNRHGEVDGLVLMYDAERFLFVHLPPHMGPELTSAVALGDAVRTEHPLHLSRHGVQDRAWRRNSHHARTPSEFMKMAHRASVRLRNFVPLYSVGMGCMWGGNLTPLLPKRIRPV